MEFLQLTLRIRIFREGGERRGVAVIYNLSLLDSELQYHVTLHSPGALVKLFDKEQIQKEVYSSAKCTYPYRTRSKVYFLRKISTSNGCKDRYLCFTCKTRGFLETILLI